MTEPKPARPEDFPKATHEGKATLFGVEVRTYRLDDGRSVIHADDFHKLVDAMLGGDEAREQRELPIEEKDLSWP